MSFPLDNNFRNLLVSRGLNPNAIRLPFDAWRRRLSRLVNRCIGPTTYRVRYFSGFIKWSFFTGINIFSIEQAGLWLLSHTKSIFLYAQLEIVPRSGIPHLQFVLYRPHPAQSLLLPSKKKVGIIKPIYSYSRVIGESSSLLRKRHRKDRTKWLLDSNILAPPPPPETHLEYQVWYAGKPFTRILGPFSWGEPPKSFPSPLQPPIHQFTV